MLPKLPPGSNQIRFACLLATLMLGAAIYLMSAGFIVWAYAVGISLVLVTTLVATTDICIPSMIYNAIFHVGSAEKSQETTG